MRPVPKTAPILGPPKDPTKPFSRSGRRILVFLRLGGRLRKVRSLERGVRGSRVRQDPSEYYWILEPPPDKRGYGMRERQVKKATVETLQAKGFLVRTFSEPDEVTAADLTREGIEASSNTDNNGNWLKPGDTSTRLGRRRWA